jgi:hypothetical protein
MLQKQIIDILDWCLNNIDESGTELCHSTLEFINSRPQSVELSWLSGLDTPSEESVLDFSPSEISQYLAIHDYIYLSDILTTRSLDELLSPIASDEGTTTFNPNLRSDQLRYWVTMDILNSSSMSSRVRLISLFIQIVMVVCPLDDWTNLVFGGVEQLLLGVYNHQRTLFCRDTKFDTDVEGTHPTSHLTQKIPPELLNSLTRFSELAKTNQSWSSHLAYLHSQQQPSLPFLRTFLCISYNVSVHSARTAEHQWYSAYIYQYPRNESRRPSDCPRAIRHGNDQSAQMSSFAHHRHLLRQCHNLVLAHTDRET